MGVVNIEVTRATLDDEPRFVVRDDRTCAMELGDIHCTCLRTWRSKGDLKGRRSDEGSQRIYRSE